MKKWIIIIIVCLIYSILIGPIAKAINKKVCNKWLSFGLKFVISFAILLFLYWIADLLGFSIAE